YSKRSIVACGIRAQQYDRPCKWTVKGKNGFRGINERFQSRRERLVQMLGSILAAEIMGSAVV
ncbi:8254_t:CDS:1, partial [Cetraspora pellucida]